MVPYLKTICSRRGTPASATTNPPPVAKKHEAWGGHEGGGILLMRIDCVLTWATAGLAAILVILVLNPKP